MTSVAIYPCIVIKKYCKSANIKITNSCFMYQVIVSCLSSCIAVAATKENVNGNGLRKTFEKHEARLISTDEKLTDCLNLLKKSAATALRKGRATTD